jgi:hypothetical protein
MNIGEVIAVDESEFSVNMWSQILFISSITHVCELVVDKVVTPPRKWLKTAILSPALLVPLPLGIYSYIGDASFNPPF